MFSGCFNTGLLAGIASEVIGNSRVESPSPTLRISFEVASNPLSDSIAFISHPTYTSILGGNREPEDVC